VSEEIIEEKSKWDLIVEALTKTSAALIVYCFLITLLAVLLYQGKISTELFKELIISGVLVAAILKLIKE